MSADKPECPAECRVQLENMGDRLKGHDERLSKHNGDIQTAHQKCLVQIQKDYKHWEEAVGKRAKISTLIAVTVIVIGVLSGLLSGIWIQLNSHERIMGSLDRSLVEVSTILRLHRNEENRLTTPKSQYRNNDNNELGWHYTETNNDE